MIGVYEDKNIPFGSDVTYSVNLEVATVQTVLFLCHTTASPRRWVRTA